MVTGNPPSGPEAFFYDLDLNKKATFTAATGLAGDGVMADASGNIALGQLILSAAYLSILSTSNSDVNLSANQAGSNGFVGASTNYCDFTVNSYTMGDAAYAAGFPWAAKTIGNFTLLQLSPACSFSRFLITATRRGTHISSWAFRAIMKSATCISFPRRSQALP